MRGNSPAGFRQAPPQRVLAARRLRSPGRSPTLSSSGFGPGSFADAEGLAFLRLPGRPVCHSLERHDRRFFFWYFNESYSDVRSLERHMRALGFFPMHGTLVAQNSDTRYQEMPG